jgi:arsenate reductase-like glutaredoxin family protein
MKIILKTDNAVKVAKVMALAKELNIDVEQRDISEKSINKEALKKRIINFRAEFPSSFGDVAEWERNEREDRKLPFSE